MSLPIENLRSQILLHCDWMVSKTNEKEKVIFGAGGNCRSLISNGLCDDVRFIIDNDMSKMNTNILGIPIKHSSCIIDWNLYYIVVSPFKCEDIIIQLKSYGLEEYKDFIKYNDYCDEIIPHISADSIMDKNIYSKLNMQRKVYSLKEYNHVLEDSKNIMLFENKLGLKIYNTKLKTAKYKASCICCGKNQDMLIDFYWSKTNMPAWRETAICPDCLCNSRMRFVIEHVRDSFTTEDIYVYEQVTCVYKELKKYFPNIIGSEYLGNHYRGGQIIDGVRHEDATALSFLDESFDCMISNDVFEHVGDCRRAFAEAFRCLRKNGKLVFSIPIFLDREKSIIRAKFTENNTINYILPPVYHGNPLSAEGSLVFTEFGWDVLEQLKTVGFSEAYALAYYSVEKAYFGNCPVIFEAIK